MKLCNGSEGKQAKLEIGLRDENIRGEISKDTRAVPENAKDEESEMEATEKIILEKR